MTIPLGCPLLNTSLRPTRTFPPENRLSLLAQGVTLLFGLAPGGVYLAASVAECAVGSYPTLSPFPLARRFAFCCTFPGVAPAGRYPAPCFHGARTFLPSPSFDVAKGGHPASWCILLALKTADVKEKSMPPMPEGCLGTSSGHPVMPLQATQQPRL
jgi:hypothetical protein